MLLENIITPETVAMYVDFRLVLFLLATGFIAKHYIKILPNDIIPLLLMVLSTAYGLLIATDYNTYTIVNVVVDSFINAAIAIGIHSSGKGLFKSINAAKQVNNSSAELTDDTTSVFGNDNK